MFSSVDDQYRMVGRSRRPTRTIQASLLLASCIACEDPDATGPELGTLQQAIVNGEVSDEGIDSTVYTTWANGRSCSGTLVAPNLVVSAEHCLAVSPDLDDGLGFSCNPDGSLANGAQAGSLGGLTPASTVEIHLGPVYDTEPEAFGSRIFGTNTTQICRNDIAFIVLDRELDAPLATVRMERATRSGESVRVLGYGFLEDGPNRDNALRVRTGLRVLEVGPDSDDGPIVSAAPRTLVVGEGPCQGDSGGPVFSEETGALLGAYSRSVGSSCTSVGVRNVYTRLQPFSQLMLQAFEAAGHEPLLEEVEEVPVEQPSGIANQGCDISTGPVRGVAGLAAGAWFLALLWLGRRRSAGPSRYLGA